MPAKITQQVLNLTFASLFTYMVELQAGSRALGAGTENTTLLSSHVVRNSDASLDFGLGRLHELDYKQEIKRDLSLSSLLSFISYV